MTNNRPKYLYNDGCYYAYRNPISKVRHGVGSDKECAFRIAEEANALLQVEEVLKLPVSARYAAYSDIISSARLSLVKASPEVRAVLPQIFKDRPKTLSARRIDAWAALGSAGTAGREKARMPIRIDSIRKGGRPNWMTTLLRHAKQRSHKRGWNCCLTIEQLAALVIRSNGFCEVSGIKLRHDTVETGRRPWAPSLDRIDCRLGYTESNCRIVCTAANFAMNQWGETVLIEMSMSIAQQQLKA